MLNLLRSILSSGPWMLILHSGPLSKLLAYRAAFLARGCRYVDGQIVYESGGWQIGSSRNPGFLQQAKNQAISLVT
jgi:hypothetical protein